MERLTIEDAINRSRKLAERHRWNSENTKLEMSGENANEVYKNTCIQYANQEEQYAKWLEELKSYRDIGTPKELKELKDNGAFTGLELAKLAIMQKELKEYKDLEEQGLLVRLPCKVGDTLWELCLCDDGNYKIFPMTVKTISEYGTLRQVKKDKTIWNIYAESDYTYMYKSFVDFGKTVFNTKEEAEKKLEELRN